MAGIFKAYDIRGIYPTELNEGIIEKIGKAAASLRGKNIAVGSDLRKSSPSLKASMIKGLLSAGAEVTDAGTITTPMMIFATANYGFDLGLVVTASHNPPQYNGVKIFGKGGSPLSYEEGISEIETLISKNNFPNGKGQLKTSDIYQDYKTFLLKNLNIKKTGLKIVVDCFNGSDSLIAPDIFSSLGATVVKLRCNFNGDFPEVGPDPSHKGNLDLLSQKVLEEKADIGLAFDGDGDRLAVVDSKGNPIETKITFSFLAENIPEGSKIVHDVLTSNTVVDSIRKNKNIPIACRVGHTYITQKIMQERAALGGELSGHFYFKETFGGDDALFAGLKVLEAINNGASIEEYASRYPACFNENKRVVIKESEKLQFVEKLKGDFSKSNKIDTLDGVKIFFDNGWAVFRPSNTEPKISIAYESSDKGEFEKIKNLVEEIISKIPQ